MQSRTHESFEREHITSAPADRSFGFVAALFFALVGLWPQLHQHSARTWAVSLSALFLALALGFPRALHPLSIVWTSFGRLLGKITNPIVTGLLFYLIFTPAGLLLRLFGKDFLRLKFDRTAATYWIVRDPPGPGPESMSHPF